jgi:hypothetical protein
MALQVKSLDTPAEVLYWTLTQGQRHDLAQRLDLLDDQDRVIYPSDIRRSQAWLQRARERGSVCQAILMAEAMHRSELRHLEDAIRLNGVNGTVTVAEELEAFIEHYRRLIGYADLIAAEDRRERAYDAANARHPLPLSGDAAC